MTRQILAASLSFGLLVLWAYQSAAQGQLRQCGPRDNVLSVLGDRYGESRQSIGLGSNNQVVEVFASLETGTWTIIVTGPNGLTCLVASGQSFEMVTESEPTPEGSAL